jgi:hypothetical protein
MTAATGARAAWTGGTYTATATENLGAITVNGDATLTINSDVTVTVTGGINVASGTLTVTGPGTLVVNGAKGNNGASGWKGSNGSNGGVAISGNIIVQGGATVTATGGTGGNGGNGALEAGNGGNGGVAFAGTLTYKSGTVTANGGSAGSGGYIDDEERYASSGSAGKAFANDVDFTQTTGYSVTNGTSTIGSVLNQTKVVISGGSEPAAATTYTVTMKDNVKDADKWTITPTEATTTGVAENTEVTLKYNGRLKVKGVKATSGAAPAAKPAATVTTAPTGAAIVGVGKSTALVSGGVADGGTLMYAVTTTNTKPTSTAGFSDAVPTAQDITASGKVYVWYYVKGDDSHSDSEIAATAIEVPVADIVVWDATNISDLRVRGTRHSYTKEGVTLSGNSDMNEAMFYNYGDPLMDGISFYANESGGFTFTAPTGKKFTKIEMPLTGPAGWDNANLGSGWAYFGDTMNWIFTVTWTGSAASTVGLLTGADNFGGESVKSIVFYLSE